MLYAGGVMRDIYTWGRCLVIIVGLGAWLIWEWSNMMNCTSTYQKHALVNSYHCLTILRHCMMVVLGQVHCQYNGRMIQCLVLSKVFGPMNKYEI
ncbi:hypothetical protein KC19_5G130800 [Ceratodon purpureus]|uniref:Uncharacterized protein n=1 Tax=Ceratodon purpureus TaxID=3225 RepID=A0A8T0I2S9_CERPU|nr:hypothetical protein KC19_5G130800 [Ceratodon purpureus]